MKRRLLSLLVILALAGLLTLVIGDWLRQVIVIPLLYVVWIGRLIFESISQLVIWVLFLLILLPLALKSLFKEKPPAAAVQPPEMLPSKRIGDWLYLLRQAHKDIYYRWQLAQQVQKLTVSALAQAERISPRLARQRLAEGDLDMPPELQAYLQAGVISFAHVVTPKARLRPWQQSKPSPLDLDPARAIKFLEDNFDDYPD
jgi:hypothetical protein